MMLLPSITRAPRADADARLEGARGVDEPRRRARVHAELVADGHRAGHHRSVAYVSRLRLRPQQIRRDPDGVAAVLAHLARDGQQVRRSSAAPASLISIGRLTPVITSTRSASRNVSPRFDGVPPNMSVRISTPSGALHPRDRLLDLLARVVHVVVPADRHGGELRQVADDRLGRVHQLGRELAVRDDDDANHGALRRCATCMNLTSFAACRCPGGARAAVDAGLDVGQLRGAAPRRSSPSDGGRRCSRWRRSGSSCLPPT